MDFLKKNKTAIGGGALVVALLYVYLTYFNGSSAPLTETTVDQAAVSGSLLITLNSLHTIRLDNTVFSDPVFASLSDFGVSIPAQDAGRRNPFAPIGKGNIGTTTPR